MPMTFNAVLRNAAGPDGSSIGAAKLQEAPAHGQLPLVPFGTPIDKLSVTRGHPQSAAATFEERVLIVSKPPLLDKPAVTPGITGRRSLI